MKGYKNETKHTVQFKLEDAVFFCQDSMGRLFQLPTNAIDVEIFLLREPP